MSELNNTALKILGNGKGILAADESTATMTKRLDSVNVPSTPENRLLFRETLFSSSSMKDCIGGVILYDETIKQTSSKKNTIPELISDTGSLPGIKVDTGAKILAGSPDEKITEGLDGLRERLKEYYKLGAKFTKWRGVYNITKNYPSKLSIHSNAHALARYSALVQECNMVPIVEPEVLMDGDHSAKECLEKTSEVIKKCFEELIIHKVDLKGIILKPNMVLAGNKSKEKIIRYLKNDKRYISIKTEALFQNKFKEALSTRSIQRILKKYLNFSGINSKYSTHTLRHTFATHLLEGGADIKVIQQLMGHSSPETTKIYTHVSSSTLKNVYNNSHPRSFSKIKN